MSKVPNFKWLMAGSILPFDIYEREKLGDEKRSAEILEGYQNPNALTLQQRLRIMWRVDPFGNVSPELGLISNGTAYAIFAGAFGGFGYTSRKTFDRFVVENKHEMFKDPREAQATLRREMYKHGVNGSIKWALKLGICTLFYTASTQHLNVIQNDITIHGHAACGFVLGSLYRIIHGPRQMLVAGIFGVFMGSFEALCQKSLLWTRGHDYQSFMLQRYELMMTRNETVMKLNQENSKTLRDMWTEEQQNPQEGDTLGSITRAIAQFFSQFFDPTKPRD